VGGQVVAELPDPDRSGRYTGSGRQRARQDPCGHQRRGRRSARPARSDAAARGASRRRSDAAREGHHRRPRSTRPGAGSRATSASSTAETRIDSPFAHQQPGCRAPNMHASGSGARRCRVRMAGRGWHRGGSRTSCSPLLRLRKRGLAVSTRYLPTYPPEPGMSNERTRPCTPPVGSGTSRFRRANRDQRRAGSMGRRLPDGHGPHSLRSPRAVARDTGRPRFEQRVGPAAGLSSRGHSRGCAWRRSPTEMEAGG
jgi:hypothetical protein